MTEQEELLKEYQKEVEKCWKLAQKLDALNPELAGDFTGTRALEIGCPLVYNTLIYKETL